MKNKYQELVFAKHMPTSTLAPNTLKVAPKTLFVKTTSAKKLKASTSIAVAICKIITSWNKVITTLRVNYLTPKRTNS